ncbi:WxcM-like domain-containing protein [Chryseobacterium arthrosphaerae]|uniref:WxcM-like domain-containing protein n=1 Tax=Chryseobacterium arthrosphaerae TaxID=651561 RepID=UPI001F4AEEE4|nr:WxcM-like domain-containing protein [Chryseobacterium arthrosphaerae]MDG4655102.1 WxcM-like domain-containing protein [Chryseobacterium arthrosphaerae]
MNTPEFIEGGKYSDVRGNLFFNNEFNTSEIKRIYCIENTETDFIRGWTGHKIEQRWFSAVLGSFTIKLVKINDWEAPSRELEILQYELNAEKLDVLHIPSGYASAIQANEKGAKLLVMANYSLGEIDDEYRFPIDYFENL